MAAITRRLLLTGTAAVSTTLPSVANASALDPVIVLALERRRLSRAEDAAYSRADQAYRDIPPDLLDWSVTVESRTRYESTGEIEVTTKRLRTAEEIDGWFEPFIRTWDGNRKWPEVAVKWRARRAAALADYKRQQAVYEAAAVATGYREHQREGEALAIEGDNVERLICETVATTPAGLLLQVELAAIYADPGRGAPTDGRVLALYESMRAALKVRA